MQAPIEVSKFRFWMITLALMFSIFLFALGEFESGGLACVETGRFSPDPG